MNENIHPKINTVDIWWDQIQAAIPAYLIKGEVNAMIDSGPPQESSKNIISALNAFSTSLSDIELVLYTHGHDDHIGGYRDLKSAGKARFLIHKDDAHYLDDPARAFDEFYAIGTKVLGDEQRLAEERAGFLKHAAKGIAADQFISDGDRITVGDGVELQVIHLPGHTKGSVGYYWGKEGILISGDAIPGLGAPPGSLPIVFDLPDYKRSLDRLKDLQVQTLVCTHAYKAISLAPSTVRRGREIKEYLSDSQELADRLIEALLHQPESIPDRFVNTADKVIAELPEEMGFVPIEKQFMPQFSLSTIFWGLAKAKNI